MLFEFILLQHCAIFYQLFTPNVKIKLSVNQNYEHLIEIP